MNNFTNYFSGQHGSPPTSSNNISLKKQTLRSPNSVHGKSVKDFRNEAAAKEFSGRFKFKFGEGKKKSKKTMS